MPIKLVIAIFLVLFSAAIADQVVVTASGTGDDLDYVLVGEACSSQDFDSLLIGSASGTARSFGIIFDNVTVPKGATVTAVVLRVQALRTISAFDIGASFSIGPYQADNQTTLNSNCYEVASVWPASIVSTTANANIDISLSTANFTTLFARAGWASGNSLAIYAVEDGTSDTVFRLKSISSFAHTLTITYTPPASGPPNARANNSGVGLRGSQSGASKRASQ